MVRRAIAGAVVLAAVAIAAVLVFTPGASRHHDSAARTHVTALVTQAKLSTVPRSAGVAPGQSCLVGGAGQGTCNQVPCSEFIGQTAAVAPTPIGAGTATVPHVRTTPDNPAARVTCARFPDRHRDGAAVAVSDRTGRFGGSVFPGTTGRSRRR